MYFSKIVLTADALEKEQFWRLGASPYRVHQQLWRLFEGESGQERDFLFRQERFDGRLGFYLVSARPPVDGDGIWTLNMKKYAPRLNAGDRLRFMVRVNPTVSRRPEGEGRPRGQRHDVIMDAKWRAKASPGEERRGDRELVQSEGVAWLAARGEQHGYSVEPDLVRVEGYRQHRFWKGAKPVSFSSVDCEGILEVTEPDRFLELLARGLGPGKGFGCGLMLVQRT